MEQILVVLFLIFFLWFAISAKKIFGAINQKGKTQKTGKTQKENSFICQKLFTPPEIVYTHNNITLFCDEC